MTRRMYDSDNPNAIPANAPMVAGYIDGDSGRWPESAWNRFTGKKVRIARRVSTNDGHVLDVEAGIPTVWPPNLNIVKWVQMRRRAGVEPTIYCNQLNDWPGIRQLFNATSVRQPYYWVARYDNVAVIPAGAIAKQYANPPLAGGHYDLSVVADYWPGVDGVSNMELTAAEIEAFAENVATKTLWRDGDPDPEVTEPIWIAVHNIRSDVAEIKALLQTLAGNGLTLKSTGEIVVKAE